LGQNELKEYSGQSSDWGISVVSCCNLLKVYSIGQQNETNIVKGNLCFIWLRLVNLGLAKVEHRLWVWVRFNFEVGDQEMV